MKQYNGEKAIISLTSWRARINTVAKTIFNILKVCPGFHIVLVLSEEEFPQKEKELPTNLQLFSENNLIEILWVKKNYKAFKKVLFTIDKYKNIPVISADDDCIYTCNYAQILYEKWLHNKDKIIRFTYKNKQMLQGPCTLYGCLGSFARIIIDSLSDDIIKESKDDNYITQWLINNNIIIISAKQNSKLPFIFHDVIEPLTPNQQACSFYKNCF